MQIVRFQCIRNLLLFEGMHFEILPDLRRVTDFVQGRGKGGQTIKDEHWRMFLPCIPVSFCPFSLGFLTILLDSFPAFGAPSRMRCVDISYSCG